MNTSNPTMRPFINTGPLGMSSTNTATMTVDGTIHKTGILAALLALAFTFTWQGLTQSQVPPTIAIVAGLIGGLVFAMIICFKPTTAPYLSPVYAMVEGFLMAAISFPLEQRFPFIVLQAASLTIATVFGMLIAYRTELIKVNNTFRAVVIGATFTIFIYYMVGMVCSFFGLMLPGIGLHGGWLSIGISGVIVVVAAMNLALDFDMISGAAGSAPKYMEWYGAFSLMVTIIWLYIEILRLLAQLRGRD